MPLDLQAKLLRVLESKTFVKLGDTQTTKVNIRILAATNRNLQKEADAGTFRLDLYYRLSVFTISLPSLNERKADVQLLANYYLKEFAAKTNKRAPKMGDDFLNLLGHHQWKGNIRELKNVMERVVILAENETLDISLLPPGFQQEITDHTAMDMASIEKEHIKKVLAHTQGNKTEAARLMGIGLTTLYRKLEEYHIN